MAARAPGLSSRPDDGVEELTRIYGLAITMTVPLVPPSTS